MKTQHGYTLIEMVIVVAVSIIMLSFATFSFIAYKNNTRVKSAIRELVVIQKSINTIAGACRGFPKRELSDALDMESILPIVSDTSCKGAAATSFKIFPTDYVCRNNALETEIRESLCKSAPTVADNNSNNANFSKVFITLPGNVDACSPQYGGPSGGAYPGNYQPGWNYILLHDNSGVEKPVGVICGMALGHRKIVKIVVNTAGYFDGDSVPEGSGCKDITGNTLINPCPCGPWCQELSTTGTPTGRQGCCVSCNGSENTVSCGSSGLHAGLGYKF